MFPDTICFLRFFCIIYLYEINKDYILVACKKGSLKIKTLQAPSKKAINSVDFVRGQRLEVGNIII